CRSSSGVTSAPSPRDHDRGGDLLDLCRCRRSRLRRERFHQTAVFFAAVTAVPAGGGREGDEAADDAGGVGGFVGVTVGDSGCRPPRRCSFQSPSRWKTFRSAKSTVFAVASAVVSDDDSSTQRTYSLRSLAVAASISTSSFTRSNSSSR